MSIYTVYTPPLLMMGGIMAHLDYNDYLEIEDVGRIS